MALDDRALSSQRGQGQRVPRSGTAKAATKGISMNKETILDWTYRVSVFFQHSRKRLPRFPGEASKCGLGLQCLYPDVAGEVSTGLLLALLQNLYEGWPGGVGTYGGWYRPERGVDL